MENPNVRRVYDGSLHCGCGQCSCPVADYDQATGMVTITDPAKPANGRFTMTLGEFNTLLANAQPIA